MALEGIIEQLKEEHAAVVKRLAQHELDFAAVRREHDHATRRLKAEQERLVGALRSLGATPASGGQVSRSTSIGRVSRDAIARAVHDNGPLTQHELGRTLGLSSATVAKWVRALEREEYVTVDRTSRPSPKVSWREGATLPRAATKAKDITPVSEQIEHELTVLKGATAVEIASRLGIANQTVYEHLQRLVTHKRVVQDGYGESLAGSSRPPRRYVPIAQSTETTDDDSGE